MPPFPHVVPAIQPLLYTNIHAYTYMMLGKIDGRRTRVTEDEIVGWHHRLNGHEFE